VATGNAGVSNDAGRSRKRKNDGNDEDGGLQKQARRTRTLKEEKSKLDIVDVSDTADEDTLLDDEVLSDDPLACIKGIKRISTITYLINSKSTPCKPRNSTCSL
jgi:hypothetical protein